MFYTVFDVHEHVHFLIKTVPKGRPEKVFLLRYVPREATVLRRQHDAMRRLHRAGPHILGGKPECPRG